MAQFIKDLVQCSGYVKRAVKGWWREVDPELSHLFIVVGMYLSRLKFEVGWQLVTFVLSHDVRA